VDKLEDIGSPSEVNAAAWTQYGTKDRKFSVRYVDTVHPDKEGSLDQAIDTLVRYRDHLNNRNLMDKEREQQLIGRDWDILTEFDEQERGLSSAIGKPLFLMNQS
jgi:hypothetical protein